MQKGYRDAESDGVPPGEGSDSCEDCAASDPDASGDDAAAGVFDDDTSSVGAGDGAVPAGTDEPVSGSSSIGSVVGTNWIGSSEKAFSRSSRFFSTARLMAR